jgi:hypothetical protein
VPGYGGYARNGLPAGKPFWTFALRASRESLDGFAAEDGE